MDRHAHADAAGHASADRHARAVRYGNSKRDCHSIPNGQPYCDSVRDNHPYGDTAAYRDTARHRDPNVHSGTYPPTDAIGRPAYTNTHARKPTRDRG